MRGIRGTGIASKTLLLLVTVATVACTRQEDHAADERTQPQHYPYKVVTTVGMITDIVRHVAGPHADVQGLIGAGVDPHLYKPTRNDVAALGSADVIFYAGLMLEGKMADTLTRIGESRPVYAVTQLIEEQYLLSPDGMDGHHDPHVWMDVSAWMQAVKAVELSLREFDPTNADTYTANAATYLESLRQLHAYAQQVIGSIPEGGRVLITAHDAFNYFGRAYNIDVMGIQGLSTESEAGLEDIRRLVSLIVERDVKAVFVESSVPDKNVRALIEGAAARGNAVTIGGELFSDAMGPAGTYEGSYIGMIDHNVTTIAHALGGEAPERGLNHKLSPQVH